MPAANILWPPWDVATRRDSGTVAAFGGVRIRSGTLTDDAYDNLVVRLPLMALVGLHTRVKSFQLAGHILQSLDGTTDTLIAEGDIGVTIDAVEYAQFYPTSLSAIALDDEYGLRKFGGWYGSSSTGGLNGDDISLWLGGIIYPWGTTNEAGEETPLECTIWQPELSMLLHSAEAGADQSAQIGRASLDDDCPIVCTLPATRNGSFDGTGCTGFTLQMGIPNPTVGGEHFGRLTGSLTLTPTAWWGHGGKYDTATGAIL